MAPTVDIADQLIILIITPDFYLDHIELTDQDPASGSHEQITKSKESVCDC